MYNMKYSKFSRYFWTKNFLFKNGCLILNLNYFKENIVFDILILESKILNYYKFIYQFI